MLLLGSDESDLRAMAHKNRLETVGNLYLICSFICAQMYNHFFMYVEMLFNLLI